MNKIQASISLKQVIEDQLKEAFEAEFKRDVDDFIERKRQELYAMVKKTANSMTLSLLQKANMDGISVEFKL